MTNPDKQLTDEQIRGAIEREKVYERYALEHPLPANPDVLAGIREQMADKYCLERYACTLEKLNYDPSTDVAWQHPYIRYSFSFAAKILALPIPIGGGVCPSCHGDGKLRWDARQICSLCNGSGHLPVVEKTLAQIIKEAMK